MLHFPSMELRRYHNMKVRDFKTIEKFICKLEFCHTTMKSYGAPLSHLIRIWHCLNCLQDASPYWITELLEAGPLASGLPEYWEGFDNWDGFANELIFRAGSKVIDPDRLTNAAKADKARAKDLPTDKGIAQPDNGGGNAPRYTLGSSLDNSKDDTRSHAGRHLEDEHETGVAARAQKPSGPSKPAARDQRATTAAPMADSDFNRPSVNNRSSLHEYADYQFHGDDDQDFVDADPKEVIINGERRLAIRGYKSARRNRRGFLIDAKSSVIQSVFSKHFPGRPKCVECKLLHPVKAYSFCRYCYFCHLGGEEECYHLHPEFRGTQPEKGRYHHMHSSHPDIEHRQRTDAEFSSIPINELADFGYDPASAVTRADVRKHRQRIRLLPVEERTGSVQALLEMVGEDRAGRLRAQEAKHASEERVRGEQIEWTAREQAEQAERDRRRQMEHGQRERLERERLRQEKLERLEEELKGARERRPDARGVKRDTRQRKARPTGAYAPGLPTNYEPNKWHAADTRMPEYKEPTPYSDTALHLARAASGQAASRATMSRAATPKPPPEKTKKSRPKSKPPTRSSTPALASYTQKGREQQTQQTQHEPAGPLHPPVLQGTSYARDVSDLEIEKLTELLDGLFTDPATLQSKSYITVSNILEAAKLARAACLPPAKPSSPSRSLGLGLGHAVPQQAQNGAAQQEQGRLARELEVPSFMKNRRRWASMSSLSTSSSEESIQQFDREHMGLKNKNKSKVKGKGQAVPGGAQDNVNPRFNGPRRPAPNRGSGGAAL